MTEVNLSKIRSAQAREMIRVATDLGWHVKNTSGGGVLLTSAMNPAQRIVVGPQMRDSILNTSYRKLKRYSDPMLLVKLEIAADEAQKDGGKGVLYRDIFGDDAAVVTDVVQERKPEPVEPKLRPVKPEPIVLSATPYLAKGGGGGNNLRYESPTTMVRRWSDGSVDYLCAWEGCDYSDPVPLSVSNHFARTKGHSVAEKPQRFRGEAWEPKRRDPAARAARLAREIEEALGLVEVNRADTEGLAQAIAQRIIGLRDERKVDDEPSELTPEGILERIRRLVDQGEYMRRVEVEREHLARIAALEAERETLARERESQCAELDARNRELTTMRSEWHALRELITSKEEETA